MEFAICPATGRLDIVTMNTPPLIGQRLLWLEQPAEAGAPWTYRQIDSYAPDSVVGISVRTSTATAIRMS